MKTRISLERYAFDDHHVDILDSANEIKAILGATCIKIIWTLEMKQWLN
jgi:hypothetical protein